MITTMRKKLIDGGAGFKIVIWIVFLSFVIPTFLSLVPNLVKRIEQGPALVTIDGTQLENRTIEHAINKQHAYIARLRQQLGDMADQYLPMFGLNNPTQRALDEVVVNYLLDRQAQNLSVSCAGTFLEQKMYDPYIVQDVMPLSVFDQRGGINAQALSYELQKQGKTLADYEAMVQAVLQRKILIGLVRTGAYVSKGSVAQLFARDYQEKQYELIQLSLDAYKKKVSVTDQEVETYFNEQTQRNKRYNVPEKRAGIVWQFPLKSYGITVSDEAVERYYNKHKHDQFVDQQPMVQIRKIVLTTDTANPAATRALVADIQKQLADNPHAFAELARKHSDDSSTAKDGGLTAYFKRGQDDADVEKAAFLLEKDGDIAPVVTTKEGYVFVQRVGRKKKTFTPLSSVEKKIKDAITERKFAEQFTADTSRLISSIAESKDAFEAFAQQKGAIKSEQPAVSNSDTTIARNLFQLKKGNATSYIDAGRGYVVQVTSITKAHTPEFKAVQDQVKTDLIEAKARALLAADLAKAFERTATESFDAVAKDMGGTALVTEFIKKDDSLKISELTKKDLPVHALLALVKEGDRNSGFENNKGYVIRVKAVSPIDEDVYHEKYQELLAESLRLEKDRVLKGFVASLQRNATIKIDTSGLTQ